MEEYEERPMTKAERKIMERGAELTKIPLKTNLIVYVKKILSPLYNIKGE
jgi:hypothetical protein